MATSAQCGHPRAQSVSQVPQAASGQAVTPDPDSGREAAGGQLLSSPAAGSVRGGWWERSFPGSTDQLTLLREVLGSLLAGCPMADDVILLMSELGANAVRHSGSGKDGGTFTARLVDLPGEYILGVIEDGGSDWDGNLPRSARDASGLYLVLALSADCGVYGGQRKRAVWFRIQYPRIGPALSATQGDASDVLPVRAPGEQGPPLPVPLWNPRVPRQTSVDPQVMERVRVALVRL
jgi:serine/threonine-protein kinase RsbW